MNTRTFTDEIYGSHFVIMWNGTPEQFSQRIRLRYDKNYDGDGDFVGRCIEIDGPKLHTIIIMIPFWHRSATGVSILVHELLHATERALAFRDIEHCSETSECYAYFLDSLVRRCLNILP